MASPQSIQAGTQEAWFMFYDSNGDPSGDSPIALASGTSRPAYKLIGIQEAPSPVQESESVSVPGDDGSLGALDFASDAPREMLMNFGLMDLTFEALLQNSNVDTFGTISMGLLDTDIPFIGYGALIIQGKAVKKAPGVSGQAAWSGWIYPFVQLRPLGRETASGRTAGNVRYKGVAQMAFNNPWGTTIVDKNGAQAGAYARPFTAAHPLTLHAFRGAITSFTLAKTPTSIATTRPYSDKVALTVSSINTPTPRLLTLSAPVVVDRAGAVFFEYE
jgi:hypothetical protein